MKSFIGNSFKKYMHIIELLEHPWVGLENNLL